MQDNPRLSSGGARPVAGGRLVTAPEAQGGGRSVRDTVEYEVWADTSGHAWVVLDPGAGAPSLRLDATSIDAVQQTLSRYSPDLSVRSVGIGVGSGALSVDLQQEWPLISAVLAVGIAAAMTVAVLVTLRGRRRAATLQAVAVNEAASREAERTRIAREIHDGPLQELALIARSGDPAGVRRGVRSVSADLRALAANLRPPALDRLGLAAALGDLADYWAEAPAPLAVRVDDGGVGRLEGRAELALYRIVQEALSNASAHGHARTAWVFLRDSETGTAGTSAADVGRGVELVVRDDGVGIPLALASGTVADRHLVAGGHFGLIGMSERARTLGATFAVRRGPGGLGTEVRLRIPST